MNNGRFPASVTFMDTALVLIVLWYITLWNCSWSRACAFSFKWGNLRLFVMMTNIWHWQSFSIWLTTTSGFWCWNPAVTVSDHSLPLPLCAVLFFFVINGIGNLTHFGCLQMENTLLPFWILYQSLLTA